MTKTPPPSRIADQFVVRFPDGMRDQIADAAKAAERSMNAEIVHRLAQSFQPQQGGHPGIEFALQQLGESLQAALQERKDLGNMVVALSKVCRTASSFVEDRFAKQFLTDAAGLADVAFRQDASVGPLHDVIARIEALQSEMQGRDQTTGEETKLPPVVRRRSRDLSR